MPRFNIVIIFFLLIALCWGQELVGAYGEYRSALVGGEAVSGVSLRFANIVDISAELWTYQSQVGWQSWSGQLRSDSRINPCLPWKAIALAGIRADMVNLSERNPSPSLSGIQKLSRYQPTFAIGAGVDSVRFICRNCNYFFSGEILIGDFVPYKYSFDFDNDIAHGETLSTTFVISGETATPFGIVGAFRKVRLRDWFGDRTWRVWFTSPYFCGGLLRGTAGWESGFLGFATAEINFKPVAKQYPVSLILGVKLPQDASLWQWSVALQFHPDSKGKRKCGSRNVEVLAPRMWTPYY